MSTVLVAVGSEPLRTGLRTALVRAGFAAVIERATVESLVATAEVCRPDICLVDGDAFGGGVAVVAAVASLDPAPRILVLAERGSAEDALDAGAGGYLLKDVTAERLAIHLDDVRCGHLAIAPALVRPLVARSLGERPAGLTRREHEVMTLAASGLGTKQIAQRLGIAATTVRRHASSAARRVGARDRAQAIARVDAVQRGEHK